MGSSHSYEFYLFLDDENQLKEKKCIIIMTSSITVRFTYFFKRDSFFINIFLLEWYIYRVSSSFASMMPRSDMNVSERNMKSGYEKIKDKIIKYMNIDENEVCIFLLTDQSTQFDPRILIQRICFIDFFLSTKILRKQNMKNCVKRLIGRLNKNVFCLIIGIDCL